MWIHKDDQNYDKTCHLLGKELYPFFTNVLYPIANWTSKQPEAHINFWYDSERIGANSATIIQNTLQEIDECGVSTKNVSFCDIRILDRVKDNTKLFEKEIPVYFRVDFLKALIADHEATKNDQMKYVVTSDSDMGAICVNQLFDEKTLRQLDEIGYTACSAGLAEEENGFAMLSKQKGLKIHKEIMIDAVIEEANRTYPKIRDQSVFDIYNAFKARLRATARRQGTAVFREVLGNEEEQLGKGMIFEPSTFCGMGGYKSIVFELLMKSLDHS